MTQIGLSVRRYPSNSLHILRNRGVCLAIAYSMTIEEEVVYDQNQARKK